MDQVTAIVLFIRALDLGSISAAARSLDISPAVASQRLKKLEQQLGVRLLNRSTRKLHPTAEGQALLEEGRILVEDLGALTENLREAGSGVAGTLRVSMPAAFGQRHISPLLPEFLAANPALKLHVDFSDRWMDLVSEGFDLAIRIGTLDDSSLVTRKLGNDVRVLCASPGYLRHHGTPASPEDLGRHQCLLIHGRHGPQTVWQLTDKAGRQHAVRVNGRIESNQGELLREAAIAGLGIAIHSTWYIGDDLQSGRLRQVLPEYALTESGIYAVMPQRHLVPPRVRVFVDFLGRQLEKRGFRQG